MKIPDYQIDAFTDKPFSGNPAAVCPLAEWIPETAMQAIASEMNLSETAFFVPRPGTAKRSEYDLRWFIPLLEVDLCGHATLASGHFIFKHMQPELEQGTFHTRSGPLGVSRRNDLLELDFRAIASLHQPWVVATAPADAEEYDFVSRFSHPWPASTRIP